MDRKLIAEKWDSFARAVIPVGTSANQRDIMRAAFHAGAIALMTAAFDEYARDADPAKARQFFADVQDELREFADELKTKTRA